MLDRSRKIRAVRPIVDSLERLNAASMLPFGLVSSGAPAGELAPDGQAAALPAPQAIIKS